MPHNDVLAGCEPETAGWAGGCRDEGAQLVVVVLPNRSRGIAADEVSLAISASLSCQIQIED